MKLQKTLLIVSSIFVLTSCGEEKEDESSEGGKVDISELTAPSNSETIQLSLEKFHFATPHRAPGIHSFQPRPHTCADVNNLSGLDAQHHQEGNLTEDGILHLQMICLAPL